MSKNKPFSYCFRVYDYEQYLHDTGELYEMGYSVDGRYNALLIRQEPKFRNVWLHVESNGQVRLHVNTVLAERVPNLDYIINELPVIKASSKTV